MRKLIAYFIKNPIYSNAIIIITAIAGALSLAMMPKSFFPELTPNKIYVNVSYPGASPEEIEEGITTRIEECTYFLISPKKHLFGCKNPRLSVGVLCLQEALENGESCLLHLMLFFYI